MTDLKMTHRALAHRATPGARVRLEAKAKTGRRLRFAALIGLALLVPTAAIAAPMTYEFTSGSATLRATLAGQSESIFLGDPVLTVALTGTSAVVDLDAGAYGRLDALTISGNDFQIALDSSRVALDTIDVFSPTISSLTSSNLNVFGQFAVQTQTNAIVAGSFPGGTPFGPVPIQSIDDSGSATGLVTISGDEITIRLVGVSVASFPQVANPDPNAPNVEIKADFTFVGRVAANPIPEPSAALLFGLGATLAGASVGRRPRRA